MWYEVYHYFGKADSDEKRSNSYRELKNKITQQNREKILTETDLYLVSEVLDQYLIKKNPRATGGSICKLIHSGVNKTELYQNFSIFMELQNEIQPGDKIYLDITHGFRSIPMFMFLMIDFIHHLRKEDNIQLAGLYYGMLEINRDCGYAPIVDLSPLFKLTQWTRGVYDFINYGRIHSIAELIEDSDIKESMSAISQLTNLNYIRELKSETDRLRTRLSAKTSNLSQQEIMFQYVKPHIEKFVNYFKGTSTSAEFQFKLAKWFFEHERYSNGYICLAESIITNIAYKCSKILPSFSYEKKKDRDKAKDLIRKFSYEKDTELVKAEELFNDILDLRNNIAHAGFIRREKYVDVISNIQGHIKQVEKLFFNSQMDGKYKRVLQRYLLKEK